ncbi:MAG: FAD-binding domain-containing protein [Beijerinckiaceae bacterium]
MLQVVWFKRDLRISDHAPLAEAARRGPVLPLYVAEPGYWALPDVSGRQWAFIAECLTELRVDLRRIGAPLVVRVGDVPELLARLHRQYGIAQLWSHEETGNLWTYARDRAVGRFCREAGIDWTEIPQFGVTRRLRDRDRWSAGFEVFMAKPIVLPPDRVEGVTGIDDGDIPHGADLGLAADACPGRQRGGRREALGLLNSFLGARGRSYRFGMSSPLTAETSCSRLSAPLSAGVISMRETLQHALAERRRIAALPPAERPIPLTAIDSFVARLHWHCHFIQKLESEPEIERRAVHPLFEAARRETAPDHPHLIAWSVGRTGFPFIDACMRSLITTGWINFRMRAMLMAFASYHLGLDWRPTGERLARLFTDYEPGIHWPQVQMQSGQTGINTPRIYNPLKQSLDQDADGVFIRRHVPELSALPTPLLHAPWRLSAEDAFSHGLSFGTDYPHRIVDHEEAAREARARLSEVRRQAGFSSEARAVYVKHGSRKRPPGDDNPRRTRAIKAEKAEAVASQLSLEL